MRAYKSDAGIVVYERNDDDESNEKLRFDQLCGVLKSKEIAIKRCTFVGNEEQFKQNCDLWALVTCVGFEMLPATYVNDKIRKIEAYPTKKEIYRWICNSNDEF